MKKVGNKLSEELRPKPGRPKTGHTKEKISVSVDRKVLQLSLAKWRARASTSGLVETLLREYAATGLVNQSSQ